MFTDPIVEFPDPPCITPFAFNDLCGFLGKGAWVREGVAAVLWPGLLCKNLIKSALLCN